MSRQNSFAVEIGTEQVLALAQRLEGATGASFNAALVRAVQATAERFDTKARRAMNASIALSDAYVSSRMEVDRSDGVPRVTITAAGPGRQGRKGLTILGHYNPKTFTGSLARPGGVTIEATRGKPQRLERRAFIMRLKKGTVAGDQMGVFERLGPDFKNADGSIRKRNWKHLYGVSPYSLFRFQVEHGVAALQDDLEHTSLDELAKAIDL